MNERKHLFFDIETNGLYNECTKIHCLAISDNGGEPILYTGDDVITGITRLAEAESVVAHNGLAFDCAVIRKLYGTNLAKKCTDTLVLSCLVNPEREGGHSLANLSKCKDDYTGGWEEYNDDMGKYCLQDVRALVKVYYQIVDELKGHDWEQSIRIEHEVARLIAWQERNGWHFDVEKAKQFVKDVTERINDADSKLSKILKPKIEKKGVAKTPITPYTATGAPSARVLKWCADTGIDLSVVCGQFEPIDLVYPDLGSRQQMIELLQQFGWKPTEWTEKGNPRFTEDSIVGKMGETGQLLVDRFVMVTRRSQVGGWIGKTRADGRIEAGAMPNATPTARMRHRTVVNVPRVTSAYGNELRQLFTVPDGRVQVGADASGLELRMLAHYMGDPDYTNAIINGKSSDETDVHSINCKLIGLEPKKQYVFNNKETSGRDVAKTFCYAILYGAGDEKLGSIIDGDASVGKRLRKKFMNGLPAYATLVDRVQKAAKKGWLRGIDGRKIYVRHEHAALNSLLQSAGSICVKVALCKWANTLAKQKVYFKLLGTFHDEVQVETLPEHADLVGQTFNDAMKWAGQYLKMRCELAGEYKVGKNWSECH